MTKTTDANFDCAFVENALFLHRFVIVKSEQYRIELMTGPGVTETSQGTSKHTVEARAWYTRSW